jgi:hypothetical protein
MFARSGLTTASNLPVERHLSTVDQYEKCAKRRLPPPFQMPAPDAAPEGTLVIASNATAPKLELHPLDAGGVVSGDPGAKAAANAAPPFDAAASVVKT